MNNLEKLIYIHEILNCALKLYELRVRLNRVKVFYFTCVSVCAQGRVKFNNPVYWRRQATVWWLFEIQFFP